MVGAGGKWVSATEAEAEEEYDDDGDEDEVDCVADEPEEVEGETAPVVPATKSALEEDAVAAPGPAATLISSPNIAPPGDAPGTQPVSTPHLASIKAVGTAAPATTATPVVTAAPATTATPVVTAAPWRPVDERSKLGIDCTEIVKQNGKPTNDDVIGVFMVIGDWGWVPGASCGRDPSCQGAVANKAKKWLKDNKYELKFVISLGDNFYGGVENGEDKGGKKFEDVWLKQYHELTCVPWYAVLGNHDFGLAGNSPLEYPTSENCYQINGDVTEVSDSKDCVKSSAGRKNLECWAMPEASYAVHAWEEELGVTLLALGVQPFKTKSKPWAYDGGYPFSEVNPKKQQTGKWAPFNHQKSLDDSKNVIEEAKKKSLADTVVVFNHYPLHWHGSGPPDSKRGSQKLMAIHLEKELKEIAHADSGKTVHYWAGHVHNTDDPNLH
eukprot:g7533.t1